MSEMPETTTDQDQTPAASPAPEPSPIHLLPANLGCLSEVAAREDAYRFALNAVSLSFSPDDTYRAEATNGIMLVRVSGPCADPWDYPAPPALLAAPNGQTAGLIPAGEWKTAFASVPKARAAQSPLLQNLACVLGPDGATLASTNLDTTSVRSPRYQEGRFPNTDPMFPKEGNAPAAEFSFDAQKLITLLKVLARFTDDNRQVTVRLYALPKGGPALFLCAHNGQQCQALLMPLTK